MLRGVHKGEPVKLVKQKIRDIMIADARVDTRMLGSCGARAPMHVLRPERRTLADRRQRIPRSGVLVGDGARHLPCSSELRARTADTEQ